MAKPNYIELGIGKHAEMLPIVYEDRSVLAIDKPRGWMLVPFSWQKTNRNLQAAITSSIASGAYWAQSRNLKFLRFVHRLDADTTGILLFAKSNGALDTYGELFEERKVEKKYLVCVYGVPQQTEWTCELPLGQDPDEIGRMKVDHANGKQATTHFKLLHTREAGGESFSLIEARPVTGRTHQIRLHMRESGHYIVGDSIYFDPKKPYKPRPEETDFPMGLRSIYLSYPDPFLKRKVEIHAPSQDFMQAFGFKR